MILSNSDTGFFRRPLSEIGEKKSFFRIRDVRYGYRTSSTGTGLFSGSGSNIYNIKKRNCGVDGGRKGLLVQNNMQIASCVCVREWRTKS